MDEFSLPKPRLRLLLEHFSAISDARQSWRVAYPLREVLFLVVCATIANSDDYDDIVDWGEAHLDFLRRFSDFHHGIPCVDWLRTLLNRVDPDLFRPASAPGSPNAGPSMPIWWPLTAKPRAAAMTARPAVRLCIWCRPSPPTPSWCWGRRRWT